MKETFDIIAVIALGIIFFELAYFLIKKNTKKVIPQDLETRITKSAFIWRQKKLNSSHNERTSNP